MKPKATHLLILAFGLTACQENFDQRLQREAKEFTETHCPQEPEPGTRLDSTTYSPATRTYTLWYTLSAENEQTTRENASLLHRLLVRELTADVNYKSVKDQRVTFRYVYHSLQSGGVVYETLVTAEEYSYVIP